LAWKPPLCPRDVPSCGEDDRSWRCVFPEYLRLMDEGDADATYKVAYALRYGLNTGVSINWTRSDELLKLAMDRGSLAARSCSSAVI